MDIFRNPAKILERLLAMGKEGIVSSADAPPTEQQLQVYEITSKELNQVQSSFELLKKSEELKRSNVKF